MSRHSRAVGAASLALALATSAAMPARAEEDRDPPHAPITVTGRVLDRQVQNTPGGTDTVSRAEFDDQLAVSLRDALAFSPGVYAQPRFGQEVRLSIRGSGISRGFHMRGLLLLQDGIPINLADNNGDFQEFDPQVFQSIQVYRGGNALRFGGSTLGGAINAVTPTGRDAPGFEARIDGGSFDTFRAKAAAGFATARGDAFLALTTDNSSGDRDHARRNAIRFNGNVGISLTNTIENRSYASVNHIRQELPGTLARDQALDDPAQSLSNIRAQDQARDVDSIRLQNRTTVSLGSGGVAFGVFLNDKNLYHPIFQVIDQKSLDYGVFARADMTGEVGGVPVEASFGTTARFGQVAAKQFVNIAGKRGALTSDTRQSARTIDTYGEVRARIVPTLSLIVGGIHTHGRREVDNLLQPLRSGAATFDTFSPKLGVLFEPAAGLQFYANANRSVELPGYSELNQTPFAIGGGVAPGFVDVDAQRAWTFEIGARGGRGIAAWDVTLYRADIRGELLQFNQAPDVPAATFNADRTRHQGVEAGLELTIAAWLRVRQVYQFNDFAFRDDAQLGDNRLPVIARHLYRGEVRLGTERLSVSPVVEWLPRGAYADYANISQTPGYAMLGVGAQGKVGQSVTLFVDARNLTDKKAIGDISAVVAANPASVIYYPVERRAVYGGIRASF